MRLARSRASDKPEADGNGKQVSDRQGEPSAFDRIESWRRAQPQIPSRSEVVRLCLEQALSRPASASQTEPIETTAS
jgi:hypothetical protein